MKTTVRFTLFALCLLLTPQITSAASTTAVLGGGVCINEVLIDPNGTNNFDTDGSGTANTPDEFIELYNLSGTTVDISGWQLWDAGTGNWFTFPGAVDSGTTVLQPNSYAVVVGGVQSGGALPTMTNPNSLAFDAGRSGGVINNGGDNIVLYDPSADEYTQLRYNGDAADNPTTGYTGFPASATLVGPVEDWGSDSDGLSLTRYPSGDTAVGIHNVIVPGGPNASPTAVSLQAINADQSSAIWMTAVTLLLLAASAYALNRRRLSR